VRREGPGFWSPPGIPSWPISWGSLLSRSDVRKIADCARTAVAMLGNERFVGLLVSASLPGGGIRVVESARCFDAALDVLLVLHAGDLDVINNAAQLRARVVRGPDCGVAVDAFLRDLLVDHLSGIADQQCRGALHELGRRMDYTPLRMKILLLRLRGLSRKEIAEATGCTERKVKWEVNTMLREEQLPNLDALIERWSVRVPAELAAEVGARWPHRTANVT
jgi:DNA-binding NarL/FixJ family response regulator